MVTDESVKKANSREIAYRNGEEHELCKQSAIYSLMGNMNAGEAEKVDINYFDLPSRSLYEKRQLIVKVYEDRYHCPIGGLVHYRKEKEDTVLKMTEASGMTFGVIQLRYQLFAIQPHPNKDPHLYWVRTE